MIEYILWGVGLAAVMIAVVLFKAWLDGQE